MKRNQTTSHYHNAGILAIYAAGFIILMLQLRSILA